ncbi:MAG: hypothetical protein HUJ31_17845, partial [Pseudomonadales bacterium]|nr:hypothetical protein [Pseudomonadales bacterium]
MRSVVLLLFFLTLSFEGAARSVELSKHNLSATGASEIKSNRAVDICTICHGRHNSFPRSARWDRNHAGTTYIPYTSSTMKALPGQPTGSSLMCLSCHDGTTATGELLSGLRLPDLQSSMATNMSARGSNLGTDLSDDHPVSFYYYDSYAADSEEYIHPDALSETVQLDASGQVQCTSCHDPHDDSLGNFLRVTNRNGELCLGCHNEYGWNESVHSVASPAASPNPNETPQGGCGLCHLSHSAGRPAALLRFEQEEENCFTCHGQGSIDSNMEAEVQKPYGHRVELTTGTHDPAEPVLNERQHVECVDCHNAHATGAASMVDQNERGQRATASAEDTTLDLALRAVSGVDLLGGVITAKPGVAREYQVCFRCHGESSRSDARVTRQFNTTDATEEFNPGRGSSHPIVTGSDGGSSPSLIAPLQTGDLIQCSSCHNNNDLQGPDGPHGSIYPALLERQYVLQDNTRESPSTYELCYKCHDRGSIIANESFSSHAEHIQ